MTTPGLNNNTGANYFFNAIQVNPPVLKIGDARPPESKDWPPPSASPKDASPPCVTDDKVPMDKIPVDTFKSINTVNTTSVDVKLTVDLPGVGPVTGGATVSVPTPKTTPPADIKTPEPKPSEQSDDNLVWKSSALAPKMGGIGINGLGQLNLWNAKSNSKAQ